MTGAETWDKLLFLSANQGQAIDAICLLLDGLEREGREANQGTAQAGIFVKRLLMYLGAFHFIVDGLEATGKALEELSEMDMGGVKVMDEAHRKAQATRQRLAEERAALFREQAESTRAARLALRRVMEREDAAPAEILEAARLLAEIGK